MLRRCFRMCSRCLRMCLKLGVIAGIGYVIWRIVASRERESVDWEAQPFPYPPTPRSDGGEAATSTTTAEPYVETTDGSCPSSHPIKAKMSSGIYHEPGSAMYERTSADRCYVDAAAAEADGLRPSKR